MSRTALWIIAVIALVIIALINLNKTDTVTNTTTTEDGTAPAADDTAATPNDESTMDKAKDEAAKAGEAVKDTATDVKEGTEKVIDNAKEKMDDMTHTSSTPAPKEEPAPEHDINADTPGTTETAPGNVSPDMTPKKDDTTNSN